MSWLSDLFGGSGGKTQTTQRNDPWGPAQPFLQQILSEAGRLYNTSAGTDVWGGPTLANLGPDTTQAMNMTRGVAQSGGALPSIGGAVGAMQGTAAGNNQISTGGNYADMFNRSGTMNAQPTGILGNIARESGTQNNVPNNVLSNFARRDQITTGRDFGGLSDRSRIMNNPSINALTPMTRNGGISTAGDFAGVAGDAGGATSADKYLTGIASGGQIGKNPYIEAIAEANANRIKNTTGSAMAGAGRYGSFAHGDALARSISDANNPLFASAYEADAGRQLQATGMLDSARQGARGQELGALQGQTGAEAQDYSNRQGTAGLLANIRQGDMGLALNALQGQTGAQAGNAGIRAGAANALAGSNRADSMLGADAASRLAGINQGDFSAGLSSLAGRTGVEGANIGNQMAASTGLLNFAPQLQQLLERPGQMMGGIGNFLDQRGQTELDAERQAFERQNQMPWELLQRLSGGVVGTSPLTGQAGTMTGNQTKTAPWFGQGGLVPGIAGGTAAGLEALPAMLAMFSDKRAKTDIEKLGKDPDTGLLMYAYRYAADPKTYPKVVGPMAQDIEKKYPGSTGLLGGKVYVKPEAVGLLGDLARAA